MSLLLYLTPEDWSVATDGGILRAYRPSGEATAATDIADPGVELSRATDPTSGGTGPDLAQQSFSNREPVPEVTEAAVDVVPSGGTLVLFASATVPHEVLPTRRERLAIVGWLCEQ